MLELKIFIRFSILDYTLIVDLHSFVSIKCLTVTIPGRSLNNIFFLDSQKSVKLYFSSTRIQLDILLFIRLFMLRVNNLTSSMKNISIAFLSFQQEVFILLHGAQILREIGQELSEFQCGLAHLFCKFTSSQQNSPFSYIYMCI